LSTTDLWCNPPRKNQPHSNSILDWWTWLIFDERSSKKWTIGFQLNGAFQ
jgi:hypothetical protein